MERIVQIKGNTAYPITLDPTVWIFDERKKKLEDFFNGEFEEHDELEMYTKAISKQWDKEVIEGNEAPRDQNSPATKVEKEEMLTETFAISFRYFLANSEPLESAKSVNVYHEDGVSTFPIDEASKFVLCFSHNGKPLIEDGPLHVYYSGSMEKCLKSVTLFEVV